MKSTIILVARDAAPSRAFQALSTMLTAEGYPVALFVGDGQPMTLTDGQIIENVAEAGLVILGMSSSEDFSREEIFAGGTSRCLSIPYGFYGDIPRCWMRAAEGAWFEDLAQDAAFFFGINEEDTNAARGVFPNAKLFATGNPLRDKMAFPQFTREEVRSKLGIAPDEKLVLVPGNKSLSGNMAILSILIEALDILVKAGGQFQLIFAPHPGDRSLSAVDASTGEHLDLYQELLQFSPVPSRMVCKAEMSTSDMVPGADCIVEFGSSIGIEGAYQAVPVISFGLEFLFVRFERLGRSRVLESVEDGLSDLVFNSHTALAAKISELLTPEGFASMRRRQELICPKPVDDKVSLRKMLAAIREMQKGV